MTVPWSRLSVSGPPSVRDSGVRAEQLLQIQFGFSHFCQSTQKQTRHVEIRDAIEAEINK